MTSNTPESAAPPWTPSAKNHRENSLDSLHSRPVALLLMCSVLATLSACDEDKPYTPFQVATSLPSEDLPPETGETAPKTADAPPPRARALRAPAGTVEWKVWGRTLKAPAGSVLQVGLPVPNSQSDEVAAWALPEKGANGPGEAGLWTFDAQGKPARKLMALPDFLPSGSDCRIRATLEPSGPQSLTSRVHARCKSRVLPGTPTESVAIVAPSLPSPVLMHLRAMDPAPGETIDFFVNSEDRDDDGSDDIEIEISLTSPGKFKETLPFRWLSRTAGASREPASPGRELDKRATRLLTSSVRKAERQAAPGQVDALRRLVSAVCSVTGAPRLMRATGASLSCGDIRRSLDKLTHVAVQSYIGQDDFGRALGEIERSDWFGGKLAPKKRDELVKLLLSEMPSHEARRLARFQVVTKTLPGPFKSPLFFSEDGQLWAQTEGTTKRLTMAGDPPLVVPATDEEPQKTIEAPTWSIEAEGPTGHVLRAALPSCERSEVLLAFSPENGQTTPPPPVPLPILAPRPGTCSAFAPVPLDVIPLSWETGALVFVVGGELMASRSGVRTDRVPAAWGTSLGVAVNNRGKLSILTGADAEGLHHCVTTKDGAKVACLGDGSVSVLAAGNSPSSSPGKEDGTR